MMKNAHHVADTLGMIDWFQECVYLTQMMTYSQQYIIYVGWVTSDH